MDGRIYPLLEVSRDELARLAGAPVTRIDSPVARGDAERRGVSIDSPGSAGARSDAERRGVSIDSPGSAGARSDAERRGVSIELLHGGFTNTLHRVTLGSGVSVVVKHYAGGAQSYADELATLTRLAGILPVPEVVRTDPERHAIVYRWIDGSTLDECRRGEPPAAFASLADPLGRLFAWVARTEPLDASDVWDVAPLLAHARVQLADSRARERMGTPLAEALVRAFDRGGERLAWGRQCLCHHDIGGRNILVQRADGDRWRIGGVIDWEGAATGSPLVDIGSLFRHAKRYDARFVADFERGYREADGELPDDWLRTARLLDAFRMIDTLDTPRELPGVFADCRMLLTQLVTDLDS